MPSPSVERQIGFGYLWLGVLVLQSSSCSEDLGGCDVCRRQRGQSICGESMLIWRHDRGDAIWHHHGLERRIAERPLGEESVPLLVALVPVPFVHLSLSDVQARGESFYFLLGPVGTPLKLRLQNLTLEAIHAGHQALSVGPRFVAGRCEHVVESISFEQAHPTERVFPILWLNSRYILDH